MQSSRASQLRARLIAPHDSVAGFRPGNAPSAAEALFGSPATGLAQTRLRRMNPDDVIPHFHHSFRPELGSQFSHRIHGGIELAGAEAVRVINQNRVLVAPMGKNS